MSAVNLNEFLPAALEIERTPPLRASRVLLWVILAVSLTTTLWTAYAEVDVVAVARGKLIPSGRVKAVQALEGGIVRAINVVEGSAVSSGDVLMELDTARSRARWTSLQQERHATYLEYLLWQAIVQVIDEHASHSGDADVSTVDDAALANIELSGAARMRARELLSDYVGSLRELDADIDRQRAEQETDHRRIALLHATIPLLAERVAALRALQQRSLVPRASWLELEAVLVADRKRVAVLEAEVAAREHSVNMLAARREALAARTHARWREEYATRARELRRLHQELHIAAAAARERRLVAPVSGTVQQLTVHTVGGVVRPADVLMHVVPNDAELAAEVWIENKDIGFISEGQAAAVKIDSFPFTKYGLVPANITHVSRDAIPDEARGLVYRAGLRLERTTVSIDGRRVNLSPGMTLAAEVALGRRRIIEFLLAPLLRYGDEALQER